MCSNKVIKSNSIYDLTQLIILFLFLFFKNLNNIILIFSKS